MDRPFPEEPTPPVFARVTDAHGAVFTLPPGALVGRAPEAQLPIDHPGVSEAHAMVSLRRGQLLLISLRRRFYVGGRAVSQARLRLGLEFAVVPGQPLRVTEVRRPRHVVVLSSPALGSRIVASVASIFSGDPPRVAGGFDASAEAHVWSMGDQWRLRLRGEAARPLALGAPFEVGGRTFELRNAPTDSLGCTTTRQGSVVSPPLRMVASYDSVELRVPGRPVAFVNGVCGRVLTELVAFGGPVAWHLLAAEVWIGTDATPAELRHRWDVTLGRLRRKLREAGVRPDLVQTDGNGQVQLVLHEGDTAVDAS